MNQPAPDRTRYPLRAVVRRTGLSADVLRAWERRYGAVRPTRSAGGQRLYSADDVERLVLLQRATAAGNSIGEIARLDRDALDALLDRTERDGAAPTPAAVERLVRDALAAADALDPMALESALKRGALLLGSEVFVDDALPRFLRAVGDRWHRGSLTPAHEHLATQVVRRVLTWLSAAYESQPDSPTIVIATPAEELHELGAMLVAAVAAGEGWKAVYLGPSLPAADIATAAAQVGASVVALSVVHTDGDATVRELRAARSLLPASALLVLGGMAAARLERSLGDKELRVLEDLLALRILLRERRTIGSAVAAD